MPTATRPAMDGTAGRSATSALVASSHTRPSTTARGVEENGPSGTAPNRCATVTLVTTPPAVTTERTPEAESCRMPRLCVSGVLSRNRVEQETRKRTKGLEPGHHETTLVA